MRKSSSRAVFTIATSGLILASWQANALALELNRINACGEIKTVQRFLRKVSDSCRLPQDAIGRAVKQVFEQSGAGHCVLVQVPISTLRDYTCVKSSSGDTSDLLCFRTVPAAFLEEYKSKYDEKYKFISNQYIEAGRVCEGSNGDSTTTGPTLFPPALTGVSAHEFGFIVQYGATRPGDSFVSHGFARLNPSLGNASTRAIEYIHYASGLKPYSDTRYIYGNWRLDIDRNTEWFSPITKNLRKNSIRSYVAGLSIDLKRAAKAPPLDKGSFASFDLLSAAADLIENEGFAEARTSDFGAGAGFSKEALKTELVKRTPFGVKEYFGYSEPELRIYMRTKGLSCMKNEHGAIGLYLMAIEGDKDIKVDFGGVFFVAVGLGACASETGSGVKFIKNIMNDINNQVMDSLKRL